MYVLLFMWESVSPEIPIGEVLISMYVRSAELISMPDFKVSKILETIIYLLSTSLLREICLWVKRNLS